MDLLPQEKRSYVRGDLRFKVKFRLVTPEEYETVRQVGDQFLALDRETNIDTDNASEKNEQTNPYMTHFLFEADEKLDQVLALLSKKEVNNEMLNRGIGTNISGSGMNLIVDKPIEKGSILHTSFVLSRIPIVFIRVFSEVVRVMPVNEDGKTAYELGIKFLYLNPNDRERIIACVFQSQRQALRKRKREKDERKGS